MTKPSMLKMEMDDVIKEYGITAARMKTAPVWVFESAAVKEIIDFITTVNDEEFLQIKRTIKCPPLVIVRVLDLEVLTVDCRKHPDEKDSTFRAMIHPEMMGAFASGYKSDTEEFARDAGSLAINCMLMRCLFKERLVERLTKHQLRIIRRTGQLGATEPRIITIAWDAPTPRYTHDQRLREEAERAAARRCLHEVHGHPRHLRSGKTVWVRGHQRGDPTVERKTIINHTASKRHEP